MTKKVEKPIEKKLGRPVNPTSARQAKLAAKAELKASGVEIKRGRPVVEGSKNQTKLERRNELASMGLLTGKRGRPTNPTSARQKRVAELEAKRASGTLKLGRPKKVKQDETND
jgi:hypothetical protein